MLINLDEPVRGTGADLHRDVEAVRGLLEGIPAAQIPDLVRRLQAEGNREGFALSVDGVVKPVFTGDKGSQEVSTLEYLHIRLLKRAPEVYTKLVIAHRGTGVMGSRKR